MTLPTRDGKILKTLLILLVLFSIFGGIGYAGWKRLQVTVKIDPPQLATVKKDLFIHEILERGSVDSASNVEIRCQVESAGGLTIISVVPEGAVVKKGDLLVELDSSTLRENVTKQRIAVLASQATVAQSRADLKTAELTLTEYLEGKFQEDKKTIENEIFTAREDVRTKEENLKYYKALLEKGYVTEEKVGAELIDLDKAKNAEEIALLKLKVLEQYTKEKNVVQYKADIATKEAKVASDIESLKLDQERLEHLETQLERCQILAPQDGQVIYYMPRWGGDEDLVKEGKKVNERQILLRLPDPSQMQVKGLVNEANIRLVKVGQTATIRLEAFPNQVFNGIVRIVNDYPEPGNWMGGSMSKEYMTTITILDPPEGIKPGLTAEARIMVNEIRDALILPVQSIFEYGGKTYCITFEDGKWEKHEIKTGATNDKEVVVLDGLKEGDRVVLGAWAHRDKVDLPKLLPGTEENGADGPPGPLENRQGENRQGEARPDGGQRERGGEAGPPGNRQGAPREGSKPKEGPRGEKPGDDKPAPPAGPRTGENKSETPRPAPAT